MSAAVPMDGVESGRLLSGHTDKKRRSTQKSAFESLPYDTQEEIECLYEFVPEVEQHFEVLDKIGEGTFSSVFLARLKHYPDFDQLFALKHIIPTSHPSRIEAELKCLLSIGGCDNVMGVELCLRNKDHVVIVMQYFPHERFQDYILKIRFEEVKDYIKNLLISLRRVHQFDIIHRDVKPSNFLWNRKNNQYALVDFGLAHKATCLKSKDDVSKTLILPTVPSAGKGILTPSNAENINIDCTNASLHKKDSAGTPVGVVGGSGAASGHRQFTPSPGITTNVFSKKVKSPRRMLLAKRALLISNSKMSSQSGVSRPAGCQCCGKAQICSLCSARSTQHAPRAGTPGFRSPEVLMKCPDQSTAVDIWSAGVIFLSLLSGRYPFFRANDDMTALAQIISTIGSDTVKEAAHACGKNLICSPTTNALDLKTLCIKLRAAPMSKSQRTKQVDTVDIERSWRNIPDITFDLLHKLLDVNPYTRITAEEALKHPLFDDSV